MKTNVFKKLFLTAEALMFALSAVAETYENPDYSLRMMWQATPTRVDRTPDATRISFHCVYPQGWKVKIDSTAYIVEPRSGAKYAPVATEGLTLNESFALPESGEVDYTIIYPALADSINEVDYFDGDWKIYGLRLDGKKAVKQSVIDIDKWQREHHKPYPGKMDKFFSPGEAIVSGVISGYDPRAGFDNISVYHTNCVTGEQRPYLAPVAPDGTFRVAIPMEGPGYVSPANFLGQWQWHYAEPGRTLEIAMDWDDLLRSAYNKYVYRDYSNPPVRYGGDLADINVRLAGAPMRGEAPVREWAGELVPSEVSAKLAEIYRNDSIAVEAYVAAGGIDDYTAAMLRHNARGQYMFDLCSYVMFRNDMVYVDPDARSLSQPLTQDFFNGLKEPFVENDEWFLGNRWMSFLPNRLVFQFLVNSELGRGAIDRYEYYDLGFDFLRSKGAELTPDEEAFENYIKSKIGSYDYVTVDEWNEIGGKYVSVLDSIASRYGMTEALEKYQGELYAAISEIANVDATAERMRRSASMIRDFCGASDMPLLAQVSLTGMACQGNSIDKKNYKSERVKEILEEVRSTGIISDSDIYSIMEKYFADYYRLHGSPLPDDARGQVVRDIVAPYSGKLIMLDFWATWCSPCRQNIEHSAEERAILRENPDFKMIFITSAGDSPLDAYDKYVAEHLEGEVSLRIPQSDYNMIRDLFGFSAIPRYVLIGRDGDVITPDFPHNHHTSLIDDLKRYGLQ